MDATQTSNGVEMRQFAFVTAAAATLLACAAATEPDPAGMAGAPNVAADQRLGAIKGYMEGDPQISVRTEGRSVVVAVTTYGDGCYQKGQTHVTLSGMVADVRPYVVVPPAGTNCTRQLVAGTHEAVITFPSSGVARIRVHGYDAGTRHAQNMLGDVIVVERQVEIR
jgi:hypothetical protein